jgi:hypothetical protein
LYLPSIAFNLAHGKSVHSKQKLTSPLDSFEQRFFKKAQVLFLGLHPEQYGILTPLSFNSNFIAIKLEQREQFIPQGAIRPEYSDNFMKQP